MSKESFNEHRLQLSVKEMQPGERPREKLMSYGAETLSNAELLAILVRTGSTGLNAVDTGRLLLEQTGGLRNLVRSEWKELRQYPGIGDVKATILESVFELARRIQTSNLGDQIRILSPEDAAAYFGPRLRDLEKEVFIVAFLNNSRVLKGSSRISSGGASATIVDPSEVFRQAILSKATSILLLHNHPSGNPNESKADVRLTKRLVSSGKLLGIPVDDHLIIAGDEFTSLRSRGHI